MAVFTIPVMILNLLGGIVSGIWLIFLGKLGLVVWAILIYIISVYGISLLLMPGLLLALPMQWALETRRYVLAYFFGPLSTLWTYVVMTAYCVWSFLFIINNHDSGSIWPYLLLGYSVATAPWGYMASKEGPDSTGSTIGAFFCCLGGIVMMIVTLFSDKITNVKLIISFDAVMAVAWILQTALFFVVVKEEKIRKSNLE